MKTPKTILLSKGGKRKMRDKLHPLGLVLILGALVLSNCGSGEEAEQPGVAETLVGTEWVLTSLNGESLIEGTEINLYFKEAFLGGSMTCNNYGGGPDSGKYVATDDGTLRLPYPIAVTVQLCSEPKGIMEQEAAYIEALRSAASYRVVDDRLEIDNAAGGTTLVFARKKGIGASHKGGLLDES
jgi:heat shock protein HslJ